MIKDDRLQLRISPAAKGLLEMAAAALDLSVSAFVLQAAMRHAEEVAGDRSTIRLTASGAAALAQALEAPAEVNTRLADALSRPRKFTWLD